MQQAVNARVSVLCRHPMFQQQMVEILSTGGFQVVGTYADERDLLSRLSADRPSVVVTDLNSLNHSKAAQLELLERVRQIQGEAKVLAICADGEPTAAACYEHGAAGYLDKVAASREALLGTVNAVGRGERAFPIELMHQPLSQRNTRLPVSPVISSLSWRERQVLSYVASGADNLKIAALLQISERTVKAHVSHLYKKLGSENRTQLALLARESGIRPADDV
jgi:two-component system, NarL family, nitrate/nitrite response regulator NarL